MPDFIFCSEEKSVPSRVQLAVAEKGLASRKNQPPERLLNASRELATAKIVQYVADVLRFTPPLTADQKSEITDLLRGGE